MVVYPSMTCDYELGKFTYLGNIEPVIPPNCGRPRIIEIPEIIIDSSDDSPEIIEPKSDSDDCQEIDESEVLFEGVKRKNGFTIDSPTKKLAISESIDSCKKIDNIQVHVTKPPEKELSDKLQKMKSKQIMDSNSNSQTNNITPPQHKYKEYNDPVHLVAEGEGHPCKWFMCHLQMDFKTIETLLDHVRGEHVEPCEGQEVYMCQWGGCKVFDVPSTSYRWYKGHVLGHTNAKMYRCLIEGCPASYRTREGLSHHMEMQNNHFIVRNENRKTNKNKNKNKNKTKSKSKSGVAGASPVARSRHNEDTFTSQRRSQRLHHTPSFKRYFADNDTEDEVAFPKSLEVLQDPVLLAIQSRAEVMTTFDIIQSIHRPQENIEPAQFIDCLSENFHHKQLSFQVLGRRFYGDTEANFEYLCGVSKTLADWFSTDTFSTLFHTSLSLSATDSESSQSNIRMRTNKRK